MKDLDDRRAATVAGKRSRVAARGAAGAEGRSPTAAAGLALPVFRRRQATDADRKHRLLARGLAAETVADKALRKARANAGLSELREVRRSCETMMAARGMSRDARPPIQSHGLGGIQLRDSDRHDDSRGRAEALQRRGAYLRAVPGERVAPMAPQGGAL